MKLLVDNREPHEIKDILKERIEDIEYVNLENGDYQIVDDSNNIICIFERKSLDDLLSSIKDGRYREQSFRLNELELNNRKIYYIIEGNINNYKQNNEINKKIIYSTIYSLSYIKEFSILKSDNLKETSTYIIKFFEKINETKTFTFKKDNSNASYSTCLKSSKKSNITKDNINEIMLMQIPGISNSIAIQLLEEYITIYNLIDSIKKNENCLDNFKIQGKNIERKLSKNVICSIKEFLIN